MRNIHCKNEFNLFEEEKDHHDQILMGEEGVVKDEGQSTMSFMC